MQPNAIWEASHNFNYSELQLAGGFLFFQEAKADRLGVAVCDKRFLKINREIEIFRILLHFAEPTKWLAFKMPHTYGHTISPPPISSCVHLIGLLATRPKCSQVHFPLYTDLATNFRLNWNSFLLTEQQWWNFSVRSPFCLSYLVFKNQTGTETYKDTERETKNAIKECRLKKNNKATK